MCDTGRMRLDTSFLGYFQSSLATRRYERSPKRIKSQPQQLSRCSSILWLTLISFMNFRDFHAVLRSFLAKLGFKASHAVVLIQSKTRSHRGTSWPIYDQNSTFCIWGGKWAYSINIWIYSGWLDGIVTLISKCVDCWDDSTIEDLYKCKAAHYIYVPFNKEDPL